MYFNISIEAGAFQFLIALPLYIILAIFWMRRQYSWWRIALYSIVFIYGVGVISMTFFPMDFRATVWEEHHTAPAISYILCHAGLLEKGDV